MGGSTKVVLKISSTTRASPLGVDRSTHVWAPSRPYIQVFPAATAIRGTYIGSPVAALKLIVFEMARVRPESSVTVCVTVMLLSTAGSYALVMTCLFGPLMFIAPPE